jgi:hypothetical protein
MTAAVAVGHLACSASPLSPTPLGPAQEATAPDPGPPAAPSPPAPSPTPVPSPTPPVPSPAPAPVPTVLVTGTVRDGLNGEKVEWGMIERYQAGNSGGEKAYQAPGGYCAGCRWSHDSASFGNFAIVVETGKPFTLTVTVAGFVSQMREMTVTAPTTVDFSLAPLPVVIQFAVYDEVTENSVRCMPVRLDFIGGPNAGRTATLTSGTLMVVRDLAPTDSMVRVSASAYHTTETTLKIRPDSDYPDLAAGLFTVLLMPTSRTGPLVCGG